MFKTVYSLILFMFLASCGSKQGVALPVSTSSADSPVVKKLNAHYKEWRGVRYAEGGMSKNGIDCSGFVHLAYKQKLRKKIPRSTERLSSAGSSVQLNKIRPGDVMFFKTGWKTRHVGIYVGKGDFIHASSSRGVMKSNLKNPYWSEAYWMSRRY